MDNKLIYSKVANIMRQTKAITKSSKNQQQGFMFRGIDDVMNELHNSFADNDVFVIPEVTDFQVSIYNSRNFSFVLDVLNMHLYA